MDQDTLRMILREAVRETTTEVLQILLNADREAFLQEHGGRKNGHYSRKLETAFGQVGLAIPRDREGRYYPSLLQPYARRLVDVGEVAIALYASGVTQRKAAEVLQLLFGMRYTHQTISTLTDQVLQEAGQPRLEFWKGYLAERAGLNERARSHYQRFVQNNPQSPLVAWAQRAVAQMQQAKVEVSLERLMLRADDLEARPFGAGEAVFPQIRIEGFPYLASGTLVTRLLDAQGQVLQCGNFLAVSGLYGPPGLGLAA